MKHSDMLTLFTVPKPFRGRIEVIQRNAIASWTLLRPHAEIVLFGDDEGTADVAKEFGLRHVSHIAKNEYGTPMLDDLFQSAQNVATCDLLCYANADIILMSDLVRAVEQVASRRRRFLMVGQRWNLDLEGPWDFRTANWEATLRARVHERGRLYSRDAIDYFVFSKGLFGAIPPFIVGRTAWDNWLIYRARKRLATVVNCTNVVMAVHQNHSYDRFGSQEELWKSVEAQRNRALAKDGLFTLDDATHLQVPGGLRPALSWKRIPRELKALAILCHPLSSPVRLINRCLMDPAVHRVIKVILHQTTN